MSAEEKVKCLIEAYFDATYKDGKVFGFEYTYPRHLERVKNGKKGFDSIDRAKSCALVGVNEIISLCESMQAFKETLYWQQVKQSLNQISQ